jgi:hypothetical protein
MLQSKNLTQQGLKALFVYWYEQDWNYIFKKDSCSGLYLSVYEPHKTEEGKSEAPGNTVKIHQGYDLLLHDLFDERTCISLAKELGVVDWSKVEVDTKVYAYSGGTWYPRYFAKYENGKVYVWRLGCTSFSANGECNPWEKVKLAED